MKQNLKVIQDLLQQNNKLTEQDKEVLLKALTDADKQWNITEFKLERTEKVKKTTAILLEETIEELEQKRKAVETQNRKLEIEASLERVRTQAMGMHKLEKLVDVCKALYTELKTLGFNNIRNAQIAINNDEKGFYLNYEYSDSYSGVIEVFYNSHPNVQALVDEMKKSKDAFFEIEIAGKELDEWRTWRIKSGETPDPFLDKATMLCYYFYSVGVGALGISTFDRITIEELNILKRFRNVFELAYRRYSDIEKAEAQAREAQVEAALERVRARVMAMNSSKELNETSLVFGEQLRKLGIDWQFSYFWLIEEDKDDNTFWITWPDNKTSTTSYSLAEADEAFRECIIAWKQQVKIHSTHIPVVDVQAWLDTFDRITANAGGVAVEIMKAGNFMDGVFYYDAMIRFGSFGILMNRATTDEEKNIQSRFAVEFERAYTRFLDLKKAEAQAKEAHIETALERVRSRTMGMQKSEELKEVIQVVYEQFVHLNILVEHAGFIMDYKARDDMNIWLADQHEVPSQVTIPYFDCAHWNSFNEAKEKGTDFFANNLSFEEKNKFYQDLFKVIPGLPEEAKEYYYSCPGLAISTVLLENVGLYIENFSGIPYADEENNILMRFGKVFQQTYTRFLDLQKAEAQAREAKIEAALEKVRSRTMAMQRSEELSNVATVLFQQVKSLGVPQWTCGFCIWDIGDTESMWYPGSPDGEILAPMRFPLTEHPVFRI